MKRMLLLVAHPVALLVVLLNFLFHLHEKHTMFKRLTFRFLMVLLLGFGASAEGYAQEFILRASVFSAGGQQSSGGNLVLQSTVGQTGVGRASGGSLVLDGGFWPQVAGAVVPVAVPTAANDAAATDEDTPVEIDVLSNDTNPGGGTLSIIAFDAPEHGEASTSGATSFTYTPAADFFGEDRFTYTIQNEDGGRAQATVTITVNPVNDAPAFTSTPPPAVAVDAEYRYVAKAADIDGDGLTFTAPTLPAWLALVEQTDSTVTLAGTPTTSDAGAHDVTLAANDGQVSAEQTFTVTVTAVAPGLSTLLLPEDETVVDPTNGVLLAWRAVPGAASYGLDLATVADFSSFESRIVGIPDTTWTFHGLSDNVTYYWRVRAENSIGNSDYTDPFSFSTGTNVATEDEAGVPAAFALHPNYPNPFNPTTTIAYDLAQPAEVRLVVYDLFGREVKTLVHTQQAAGRYTVAFEAEGLASGTYFYRIDAGVWSRVRQFVLLK